MIRSKNIATYDAVNGNQDYIYASSTLEIRPNNLGYIIKTNYFRRITVDNQDIDIRIAFFEEEYTSQDVDALFDSLEGIIGSLPFTEMVQTGIELALLDFLNTHDKFGIAANTDGWEII